MSKRTGPACREISSALIVAPFRDSTSAPEGCRNIGVGREKGEVEQDEEGLRTMAAPGENMAGLLKRVRAGVEA